MIREEAIEILKAHHMWTGEPQEIIDVRKENKALEMAIQALSQEPCIYDLKNRYCPRLNEHGMLKYPLQEQTTPMSTFDIAKQFGIKLEPCDDAISRKLAIRAIKNLYPDIPRVDFNGAKRKWADKYAQYIECERLIEQLPSVTQKSGKWKSTIDGKPICSECGFVSESEDGYFVSHYCPNCGAKMESEE